MIAVIGFDKIQIDGYNFFRKQVEKYLVKENRRKKSIATAGLIPSVPKIHE